MPARNTGSTSSRYMRRSSPSVSVQSWPERIRQRPRAAGRARGRPPPRPRAPRGRASGRSARAGSGRAYRPDSVARRPRRTCLGQHGHPFRAAERGEQRLVLLHPRADDLGPAAVAVADAVAEPGVPVGGPPAVERVRVDPVGRGDDLAVAGGPVVVHRSVRGAQRGVEGVERRRLARGLQAEVGHHHLADLGRVAGDEGRVRRRVVVRDAARAGAFDGQVRRDGRLRLTRAHGSPPRPRSPPRARRTTPRGRRGLVEQQPGDVGARVVARRVGRRLGQRDHAEVEVGVDDALGVFGQRLVQQLAVGAVDARRSRRRAGASPSWSVVGAEQLDHLRRDGGARGDHEAARPPPRRPGSRRC